MLIIILNRTLTGCIYERIDEKQKSIRRLQPVAVLLVSAVIFCDDTFLCWEIYEMSTFLGYKIMIGTVDSFTTLWHILR